MPTPTLSSSDAFSLLGWNIVFSYIMWALIIIIILTIISESTGTTNILHQIQPWNDEGFKGSIKYSKYKR
jgi:hypothetical protein